MSGAAGPGEEPDVEGAGPQRLVVTMGKSTDPSRSCRVTEPDRVLRIWALLNRGVDELRQVELPPGAAARRRRQLDALTAELERSLSLTLAAELHHLVSRCRVADPTADELRIEYATLLGWTAGLVVAILSQLEAASAKTGRLSPAPQVTMLAP